MCTLSSVPDLYCQAVQQLIGAVLQCAQMLSSSTKGQPLTLPATPAVLCLWLFGKHPTSTSLYRCMSVECWNCRDCSHCFQNTRSAVYQVRHFYSALTKYAIEKHSRNLFRNVNLELPTLCLQPWMFLLSPACSVREVVW